MSSENRADIVITAVLKFLKNNSAINGAQKQISKAQKLIERQSKKFDKATSKQKPFQGWALSIMFAGQQISTAMQSIWASSSKVFNEVKHSVEGTVTGFDMLTGSMVYLGFVVGSALEPLAMMLIPIIDSVSEWVMENEELVRGLFVFLTVFGTAAALIGAAVLAISGFSQAWTIAVAATQGAVSVISGVLGALATALGLPVIAVIAIIVGAIALLAAAWYTNFAGIQEFIKNTFGIIWNTIKSLFKNIIDIFKGVFMVFKGIFTGDFDMVLQGLVKMFAGVAALIIKIILGLGAAIINIFIFAINIVNTAFLSLAQLVVGIVKTLLTIANKIQGIKIPGMSTLVSLLDKMDQMKKDSQIGYLSADSISAGLSRVDQATAKTEQQVNNTIISGPVTIMAPANQAFDPRAVLQQVNASRK